MSVKIYNASNFLVRTITKTNISCPSTGAATSVTWDGKNSNGFRVLAGTYTYKIQAYDKAMNYSIINSGTATAN
ncbi:MAG: hypothetical protein HZA08_06500 [Nitrospirae bacterium]|nr:hypothetical protein [Nitrospirota bacterium]